MCRARRRRQRGCDTALHVAAGGSIIEFLAEHGARLDVKNQQGKTPYDIAVLRKDRSGRQLLPCTVDAFRQLRAPATVPIDARPPDEEPAAADAK